MNDKGGGNQNIYFKKYKAALIELRDYSSIMHEYCVRALKCHEEFYECLREDYQPNELSESKPIRSDHGKTKR